MVKGFYDMRFGVKRVCEIRNLYVNSGYEMI